MPRDHLVIYIYTGPPEVKVNVNLVVVPTVSVQSSTMKYHHPVTFAVNDFVSGGVVLDVCALASDL